MYYGGGNQTKVNNRSQPLKHPFVSLYLRGRTEGMVLKGGDATRGQLMTMFDGARPDCAIADTCNRHKDQVAPRPYDHILSWPSMLCQVKEIL
jgi:non-reducing end alpha-L-arabinofuranosidase